MKAREIVRAGESALVIFTRGGRFVLNSDGTGSTGNWVLNPNRKVDRVIIYKRDTNGNQHEIYAGIPFEIVESEEAGRRQVKLADLKLLGTTSNNWNEFADTKRGAVNPIKYISKS